MYLRLAYGESRRKVTTRDRVDDTEERTLLTDSRLGLCRGDGSLRTIIRRDGVGYGRRDFTNQFELRSCREQTILVEDCQKRPS